MTFGVLAWLAGCSSVTVEGRIVDGMTGEPIPGPYKLSIKAQSPDASLSCQFKQVEVGADGKFSVPGLCSGTTYKLETDKEDLWLAETDEVPDGGFPAATDIKAWRAPKGSGVYRYAGGEFEVLKTAADVATERIRGTGDKIRYPDNMQTPTLIGPGEHLVLVGKGTIEEFDFFPLVPSGPRVFGDENTKITMDPWIYVGVRFQDDTKFETVDAVIDTSKQLDKEKGNRVVRWMQHDALPAGRYALFKEGDRRMYVIDFGSAPASASTPEPAEEGKAGKGGKGKAKAAG